MNTLTKNVCYALHSAHLLVWSYGDMPSELPNVRAKSKGELAQHLLALRHFLRAADFSVSATAEPFRGHYPFPPEPLAGISAASYHELAWHLADGVDFTLSALLKRDYSIPEIEACLRDHAPHFDLSWLSSRVKDEAVRAERAYPPAPTTAAPATVVPPAKTHIVLNAFQQEILAALDGRALTKQSLADKVCGGEGSRLYRLNGIKELREAGLVAHKNRIGYYRPDAPPEGMIVPTAN